MSHQAYKFGYWGLRRATRMKGPSTQGNASRVNFYGRQLQYSRIEWKKTGKHPPTTDVNKIDKFLTIMIISCTQLGSNSTPIAYKGCTLILGDELSESLSFHLYIFCLNTSVKYYNIYIKKFCKQISIRKNYVNMLML